MKAMHYADVRGSVSVLISAAKLDEGDGGVQWSANLYISASVSQT
jgi:hypothetical protein